MNKKQRMYKRIEEHGINLKAIFDLPFDTDAIKLAKQVHSIEVKAHKLAEDNCNGYINTDEEYFKEEERLLNRLDKVLNFKKRNIPVFLNGDPRGYALKIHDKYVRDNNLDIHRDWGGYGILAPEFDGKE